MKSMFCFVLRVIVCAIINLICGIGCTYLANAYDVLGLGGVVVAFCILVCLFGTIGLKGFCRKVHASFWILAVSFFFYEIFTVYWLHYFRLSK